ncbi:hypothetical protein M0812_10146 [Anaeramoeba flamelloides]|uniref:Uncharacterized protein n=1 Tax=Anaeramoeba flamelloides TaxID=1746091 RepID=A0AAV7ZQK7_9EUKA|nr:hypothetical protein M0812_10146 [Anaeramoeba flamelloides]
MNQSKYKLFAEGPNKKYEKIFINPKEKKLILKKQLHDDTYEISLIKDSGVVIKCDYPEVEPIYPIEIEKEEIENVKNNEIMLTFQKQLYYLKIPDQNYRQKKIKNFSSFTLTQIEQKKNEQILKYSFVLLLSELKNELYLIKLKNPHDQDDLREIKEGTFHKPLPIGIHFDDRITQICRYDNGFAIVLKTGDYFQLDLSKITLEQENDQNKEFLLTNEDLRYKGNSISKIFANDNLTSSHYYAITGDGHVVCWGNNDKGQLNEKNEVLTKIEKPVRKKDFDMQTIKSIYYTNEGTVVLTNSGRCYTYGKIEIGKEIENTHERRDLFLPKIRKVQTYRNQIIFLANNGMVYCLGKKFFEKDQIQKYIPKYCRITEKDQCDQIAEINLHLPYVVSEISYLNSKNEISLLLSESLTHSKIRNLHYNKTNGHYQQIHPDQILKKTKSYKDSKEKAKKFLVPEKFCDPNRIQKNSLFIVHQLYNFFYLKDNNKIYLAQIEERRSQNEKNYFVFSKEYEIEPINDLALSNKLNFCDRLIRCFAIVPNEQKAKYLVCGFYYDDSSMLSAFVGDIQQEKILIKKIELDLKINLMNQIRKCDLTQTDQSNCFSIINSDGQLFIIEFLFDSPFVITKTKIHLIKTEKKFYPQKTICYFGVLEKQCNRREKPEKCLINRNNKHCTIYSLDPKLKNLDLLTIDMDYNITNSQPIALPHEILFNTNSNPELADSRLKLLNRYLIFNHGFYSYRLNLTKRIPNNFLETIWKKTQILYFSKIHFSIIFGFQEIIVDNNGNFFSNLIYLPNIDNYRICICNDLLKCVHEKHRKQLKGACIWCWEKKNKNRKIAPILNWYNKYAKFRNKNPIFEAGDTFVFYLQARDDNQDISKGNNNLNLKFQGEINQKRMKNLFYNFQIRNHYDLEEGYISEVHTTLGKAGDWDFSILFNDQLHKYLSFKFTVIPSEPDKENCKFLDENRIEINDPCILIQKKKEMKGSITMVLYDKYSNKLDHPLVRQIYRGKIKFINEKLENIPYHDGKRREKQKDGKQINTPGEVSSDEEEEDKSNKKVTSKCKKSVPDGQDVGINKNGNFQFEYLLTNTQDPLRMEIGYKKKTEMELYNISKCKLQKKNYKKY